MNIFATYSCPIKSAKYLDNKRQIKMILESAQLLCTALNLNGVQAPYKTTHLNHPAAIWVRQSRQNYSWLLLHLKTLCNEYSKKYNKIHKTAQYIDFFEQNINILPDNNLSPFVNCAANSDLNISFKHISDTHLAYRLYLRNRWKYDKIKPKWK